MRNPVLLLTLVVFFFKPCSAAVKVNQPLKDNLTTAAKERSRPYEANLQLDRKILEKQLRRKLKLKERIGLWVINKNTRKRNRTKGAKKDRRAIHGLALPGFFAAIFAIAAVIFRFYVISIIMALLAFIFGKISGDVIRTNPQKWKGKGFAEIAYFIGMIGGGLLLLLAGWPDIFAI